MTPSPKGPLGHLSPEFQALCIVTGDAALGTRTGSQAAAALRQIRSWPDFVSGIRRHRVASIILPRLRAEFANEIPTEILAAIKAMVFENAARGLSQYEELRRLQRLFRKAGQTFLVLKGLPLSQRVHGNPTIRGVGDMDLLIASSAFTQSHQILLEAGYALKDTKAGRPPSEAALKIISDLAYLHPDGHLVELHLSLFDNHTTLHKSFADLWLDRDEVVLFDEAFATLPKTLLPIYLAEHGARHSWDRLCWMVDLGRLLQSEKALDDAMRGAQDEGLSLSLTQALALSNIWFNTTFPVPPHPIRMRIFLSAFCSDRRWLERPSRGSVAWFRAETRRRFWRIFLGGTVWHAWGELRFAVMNPVDWALFPLPDRLWWLFPFLRPLGWLLRNYKKTRAPP